MYPVYFAEIFCKNLSYVICFYCIAEIGVEHVCAGRAVGDYLFDTITFEEFYLLVFQFFEVFNISCIDYRRSAAVEFRYSDIVNIEVVKNFLVLVFYVWKSEVCQAS